MKSEAKQKIIFFAYQGKFKSMADENAEAIKAAIKSYNQFQHYYEAKSWEDSRNTAFISKEILTAINECEVFVADLTYLNHNVLFELGYAIAKKKKILLLLNTNLSGVSQRYQNFILKDIRYKVITNAKDIHLALQNREFEGVFIDIVDKLDASETVWCKKSLSGLVVLA